MGKQLITDFIVVIIIPAILIGGYKFLGQDGGAFLSLLSSNTAMNPGDNNDQLGSKTEAALAALDSIHLNDSIFTDPAYLMLREYQVPIPTSPLGRQYPFSMPPVLLERMSRAGIDTPIQAIKPASAAPIVAAPPPVVSKKKTTK